MFFLLFFFLYSFFVVIMSLLLGGVESGDAKKLGELIRQDPGFTVNMLVRNGRTLLHHACIGRSDSRSPMIPLLLAHPEIDVNVKNRNGSTPFMSACSRGHTSCVRLMLLDSRVMVNEADNSGRTPLWAAHYSRHDVIGWWIASGREMDLRGEPGNSKTGATLEWERRGERRQVATLLERFKKDAAKTRSEVRKGLGITGQSTCCSSINFSILD